MGEEYWRNLVLEPPSKEFTTSICNWKVVKVVYKKNQALQDSFNESSWAPLLRVGVLERWKRWRKMRLLVNADTCKVAPATQTTGDLISGSLRGDPKGRQTQTNSSKRRQTLTQVKSKGYTLLSAPPLFKKKGQNVPRLPTSSGLKLKPKTKSTGTFAPNYRETGNMYLTIVFYWKIAITLFYLFRKNVLAEILLLYIALSWPHLLGCTSFCLQYSTTMLKGNCFCDVLHYLYISNHPN